jgi:hypothetical protein
MMICGIRLSPSILGNITGHLYGAPVAQPRILQQVEEHAIDIITYRNQH